MTAESPCPACGRPLPSDAMLCEHCGEDPTDASAARAGRETDALNTRAVIALVLGIVALAGCSPLGIVAVILGGGVNRRLKELGLEPNGLATAGHVIGWIAVAFLALQILAVIGFIVLAVASG